MIQVGKKAPDFTAPGYHKGKFVNVQLSEYLGVIREIIERPPSPDTWNAQVSDEEFYFRIPYETLDLLLYAWEYKIPIGQICETMNLTEDQVKRAQRDFNAKYNATQWVRQAPPTLE